MIYRCIIAQWAATEFPTKRKVFEGEFTDDQIADFNNNFYNIYFLPNYPNIYDPSTTVDGTHIDTFRLVFADMDLKDGIYKTKQEFIDLVLKQGPIPTFIVDSGNGVHAYWQISDLDALSFLKLQRRICRKFQSDEAVSKIYQLMRTPGTINTKNKGAFKECNQLFESENVYTCEDMDKVLPQITKEDLEYCQDHYNSTYNLKNQDLTIDLTIPLKFMNLIQSSQEVKDIWSGKTDDRSASDYRLGHIMFASGFNKEEAMSVLANSGKALQRAPRHRINYASNIVDKIWTYELTEDKNTLTLSNTVREILTRFGDTLKGTRFPCYSYLDNTAHGFRLGQVVGLVAGSGVGKTAMALNMFEGFVQNNPDYDHFFIPLEQPANEIADRWKTMCGDNLHLYDKVHVISNYAEDGSFRHLSFEEIKNYLLKFQQVTKRKIGCVVLDHIGALKKKDKDGSFQGIEDICHEMKAFALATNTLLVMQSQTNREKAGIGDLELFKDAAYGTVFFESYCDYLITIHQPLKRCYTEEGCPTVTSFKFCKIRHKKRGLDVIEEDVNYRLFFDSKTERLREMTQDEEKAFDFFNTKATNKRKLDRKTDIVSYKSTRVETDVKG